MDLLRLEQALETVRSEPREDLREVRPCSLGPAGVAERRDQCFGVLHGRELV